MTRMLGRRFLFSLLLATCLAVQMDPVTAGEPVGDDGGTEELRTYATFLNELSSRRRANVYFPNEQAIFYGVQVGHVNVGRGNLTFVRRDLVTGGRLPLVLARVYDSSLTGGEDFVGGWRLTAAETLHRLPDGSLLWTDESASPRRFLPVAEPSGSGPLLLEPDPPGPTDIINVRYNGGDLVLELANGLRKHFSGDGEVYRLTQVADRNGNSLDLHYEQGRLMRLEAAYGHYVLLERSVSGRLLAVSDDQGRRVEYRYDSTGRLAEARDLASNHWRYRYDALGRLTAAMDPLGGESFSVDYGSDERVRSIQTPGRRYEYLYQGSLTEVIDGNGESALYEQNPVGITVRIVNPMRVESRVLLNDRNQVREIYDNGELLVRLSYDDRGRLAATTRFSEAGPERRVYLRDEAGHLHQIREQDAAGPPLATFLHDPRGNLVERRDVTGSTLYGYSPLGDLTELIQAGEDAYRLAYTADGQIAAVTDGLERTTRFEHRPDGKLARTLFADGEVHAYAYNDLGVRTLLDTGNGWVGYSHNASGSVTGIRVTRLDGEIHGHEVILDEDQKVVAIEYLGKGVLSVDYDGMGNPMTLRAGRESLDFGYDELGRLLEVVTVRGEILRYDYRDGEPDLRVQTDRKTGAIRTPRTGAALTFSPDLRIPGLRSKRSAYGAVALDSSTQTFQLVGANGSGWLDTVTPKALERLRLLGLGKGKYQDKASFEQPSNVLFLPAEIRSLNCCIECEYFPEFCVCVDPVDPNCEDCYIPPPLPPPPVLCNILSPPTVTVAEPNAQLQVLVNPQGTPTNWRHVGDAATVQNAAACVPMDSSGKIAARAAVAATVQMTCNYGSFTKESNQFTVTGQAAPQYVRLTWAADANAILSDVFSNGQTENSIRNRVRSDLINIFAGVDIVFANVPGPGISKITTLTIKGDGSGQGGEAGYDRLNFKRDGTGLVFIGTGSLDLRNPADPSEATPFHERRTPDRVADAIARIAAHEIAHMLGLVPRSAELTGTFWGELAECHGVDGLGLSGTSSHHNSSSSRSRVMSPTIRNEWRQTWDISSYSFMGTNKSYLTKVLP